MSLVLRYAARSDRGLVRTNNEDSVYAGARLEGVLRGPAGTRSEPNDGRPVDWALLWRAYESLVRALGLPHEMVQPPTFAVCSYTFYRSRDLPDRPNPSARNVVRLGLPVVYVRANWGPRP